MASMANAGIASIWLSEFSSHPRNGEIAAGETPRLHCASAKLCNGEEIQVEHSQQANVSDSLLSYNLESLKSRALNTKSRSDIG